MSNTLGVYNPIFYAQEALIQLHKALGMAGRVYRGYDEERKSFGKGDVINIRRPSTFSAQDAPSSSQDLATETVALTLAYWKEVKFQLTDKELSISDERIISDHIAPAAVALADDIDQKLCALYKDVPWYYDIANNGSTAVTDIISTRKVMFDNKVPMADAANMHFMVDGNLEAGLLGLSAFTQNQGAGQQGVEDMMRGTLGRKYGYELFANQNVPLHTAGTCADATGAVDFGSGTTAVYAKGVSTIHIDGMTSGGTMKAGDSFVIAGNDQRYAVTADVTFTAGEADVSFTPPLVVAIDEDAVVTGRVDTHRANLAFHRNAFALAMAPLTEMGKELGAKIATITDPITGLAIRSRVFYVGDSSLVKVALDVLYGVKTLDPNLACRACGQS